MRGMSWRPKCLRVLCVLCLAGAIFSLTKVVGELAPRMEAEHAYRELCRDAFGERAFENMDASDVANRNIVRKTPDWCALQERNPDICGWIYSPGTSIDYPVVQGSDNTWYLEHTAEKKKNVAGAIFLDSANHKKFEDDISVLYGHHIRGGRMFSSLSGYKEQKYYEEHPGFYLYTPEAAYWIELFAGNVIDGGTDGFLLEFADDEMRREWTEKVLSESTFKSRTKPQDREQILALCTCSYEYYNARFVVYGMMKKLEAVGNVVNQIDIEDGKENAE